MIKPLRSLIVLILLVFLSLTAECKTEVEVHDTIPKNNLTVVSIEPTNRPLFIGSKENSLASVLVNHPDTLKSRFIKKITITFSDDSEIKAIDTIRIYCGPSTPCSIATLSDGRLKINHNNLTITENIQLLNNLNKIRICAVLKKDTKISGIIKIDGIRLYSDNNQSIYTSTNNFPINRFAYVLRAAGEDKCNAYRIPGLIKTNSGTLIAVYDNRYESSIDLQGNIEIGMSRSLDKGQTWEPMRVIMSMDEWGGKSRAENGTGDPCILVDKIRGTVWVAALWCHGYPGLRAWNSSAPGIDPATTGQFLVVKSDDDGLTWSGPINLTPQIKNPSWRLLLQGPGNGITLTNGTLVFPAQYRDSAGVPFSTIVYSNDHGVSWHIGTGVKSNTTESQVVELSSNSLMINMRDDRNRKEKGVKNGRAVATTTDLGKTWIEHPTSNSSLPEPNCMASLISADLTISGKKQKVLFFSNPNNRTIRANMTIKASIDDGMTWPEKYWFEVDPEEGYGYSCLTMIDQDNIGILYEGEKELYFQKIPVINILKYSK